MARLLRRCSKQLQFLIISFLTIYLEKTVAEDDFRPHFNSLTKLSVDNVADNEDYQKVVFEVHGHNIKSGLQIKTTLLSAKDNNVCAVEDLNKSFNVSERSVPDLSSGIYVYEVLVPKSFEGRLFFCLPSSPATSGGEHDDWHHQGENISLRVDRSKTDTVDSTEFVLSPTRKTRDQDTNSLTVFGLRLEASYKDPGFDENGVPELLANAEHTLRIFGTNFVKDMTITFTTEKLGIGDICHFLSSKGFPIRQDSFAVETAVVDINLPPLKSGEDAYYICVKNDNYSSNNPFIHQGSKIWLQIKTYENPLPVWAAIVIICVCLMFSALFSGLNLGLMSMDRTELKILCNTGTAQERKYAKIIQPVRMHGNYLLCSILLGNVLVNSIFTILLDGLTSGLIAVIFSTLAIVMFGEITPQAVCSRHGLLIGARTIYITKIVMALTFPLAYPISKFLDCALGEEIGNVYNRERLKELVKVTTGENDLDKDEVNIISGALELRRKTVGDVMTRIEDVFMLDYEAVLDFETVSEIMKSGYSRVPVFEGNRQNIVTMLYIKDLAFVDPDDNTPLKTLCQFYQNPCNFVFEDVTLDVIFRIFKEGNKGHMAFVHRVNNEGEGDPFYETVGLITLEDVIEELIQAEIMDETDVFTDNRSKRKRTAERRQDFTVFNERRGESSRIRISPQLTLAAFQFLSTSVEQFLPSIISETILRRLLSQDIVYHVKKNKEWRTDPGNIIYQQGKVADYFVLILEGRVEVTIGRENLMFEGGPFTYFGTQALVQAIGVAESPSVPTSTLGSLESLNLDALLRHTFQPDYNVRAINEVIYLRIKRNLYLAAKRATLMERSQRDHNQTSEQFDAEVDKLLHSLDDEDNVSIGRRTPHRKRSSKNLSQQPDTTNVITHKSSSHNTSPKTPSLYSNVSPPHRISQRDINGSIKSSSVDDVLVPARDEEAALLPKKS